MTGTLSTSSIQLQGLSYRYTGAPRLALDNVSADLRSRKIALLGPNGAGKSTLFDLLSTVRTPVSGAFAIGSYSSSDRTATQTFRNRLGVMPQQLRVFGGYTCEEFLRYVAWLRRVPLRDVDGNVTRALIAVGLESSTSARVRTLSGGMKQRLGLAQTLVARPAFLLLDEPTVGLDPQQRAQFINSLAEMEGNVTVLMATHLVEDVAAFAEEVLVLDQGSVRYAGDLRDFCGVDSQRQPTGQMVEHSYLRAMGAHV